MTTVCDRIRTHLSALADGELEPFEAIAVRRHLGDCPACSQELSQLEGLKVRVHVAGGEAAPDPQQDLQWRAAIADRAAERARAGSGPRAYALLAAACLGAALTFAWPVCHEWAEATWARLIGDQVALDHDALRRMVTVHRGESTPQDLDDFVQAGALLTFENLPGSFITSEGERRVVRTATYVECESEKGSSLAVLKRDEVQLASEVRAALETGGVFVDVVQGAEVRVSVSGDKVFVLLSDGPGGSGGGPI